MSIFREDHRDILKYIFAYLDCFSLFRLRRCSSFLHRIVKGSCYIVKNHELYVNGKLTGSNRDKSKYYTDEYIDTYIGLVGNSKIREYNDGMEITYIKREEGLIVASSHNNIVTYRYDPGFAQTNVMSLNEKGDRLDMDIYVHLSTSKYLVVSNRGDVVRIYTKKGLLLEVNHKTKEITHHNKLRNKNTKLKKSIDESILHGVSDNGKFAYCYLIKYLIEREFKEYL